jgi:hypothetical protein
MCVTTYLQNISGVSGPKIVKFIFNPNGFSNVTPLLPSIPGTYNPGNWISSSGSNSITYTFIDSAGLGRGDFDGNPNTCLRYNFCFNITPLSNDPLYTNILDSIYSDTYGMGFSGIVYYGCCPSGFPNCHGGSSGGLGGVMALGFGFNDPPGGALPVSLLDFNAETVKDKVHIFWKTASEINNNYFTVERSANGIDWEQVSKIRGSGNSSNENNYFVDDDHPLVGETFYRLSQTDFDGKTETFSPVRIYFKPQKIICYPNPAADKFHIQYSDIEHSQIILLDLFGKRIKVDGVYEKIEMILDVSAIEPGIYILQIVRNEIVFDYCKIVIQH